MLPLLNSFLDSKQSHTVHLCGVRDMQALPTDKHRIIEELLWALREPEYRKELNVSQEDLLKAWALLATFQKVSQPAFDFFKKQPTPLAGWLSLHPALHEPWFVSVLQDASKDMQGQMKRALYIPGIDPAEVEAAFALYHKPQLEALRLLGLRRRARNSVILAVLGLVILVAGVYVLTTLRSTPAFTSEGQQSKIDWDGQPLQFWSSWTVTNTTDADYAFFLKRNEDEFLRFRHQEKIDGPLQLKGWSLTAPVSPIYLAHHLWSRYAGLDARGRTRLVNVAALDGRYYVIEEPLFDGDLNAAASTLTAAVASFATTPTSPSVVNVSSWKNFEYGDSLRMRFPSTWDAQTGGTNDLTVLALHLGDTTVQLRIVGSMDVEARSRAWLGYARDGHLDVVDWGPVSMPYVSGNQVDIYDPNKNELIRRMWFVIKGSFYQVTVTQTNPNMLELEEAQNIVATLQGTGSTY